MNHKYPRFKVPGRISLWQVLSESYMHFKCKSENIEWSLGRTESKPIRNNRHGVARRVLPVSSAQNFARKANLLSLSFLIQIPDLDGKLGIFW
ncbi:hypothetical protein BDW69DRAFT_134891 [Aspergillus filifer]